jgi:tetratricopeptide (TPR) repeat protein/curved DNA-binding protein CbpA
LAALAASPVAESPPPIGKARGGDALESRAMKTAYEVLGVPRHADDKAIRAAFRKAAKAHHPDLNAGDKVAEQSFRQIADAYQVLKDPEQRGAYDLSLRKRRFGMIASVVAGLVCGGGLTAIAVLSKTPKAPPEAQSRQIATPATKPAEPREVAALQDVGNRKQETGAQEASANESAATEAAANAHLIEDRPQDAPQLATSEEVSVTEVDVPTPHTSATGEPTTSELMPVQATRSTMDIWVSVVRNPDILKEGLGRSDLLQLIDAAEDVRLLRALDMGANGAIAQRARQRLIHLSHAVVTQDAGSQAHLGSENGATPSSDPAVYLARCGQHIRRGNFDAAIADCDEAIRLEPGKAQAYGQRGRAWAGKGDAERARADYESAIRIDPRNSDLLCQQGRLWRQLGDLDGALAAFDQAIRLGFSDAGAYNERGQVWLQKGRYERAIADFNQALKINPGLVGALINRGIAWRKKGALDRAIADFGQVISIDPTQSAAYYNRGLARSETQDIELAMADFTKAWELLPDTLSSEDLP